MAFNNLLKGELSWLNNNSSLSVLKLDGIEYKDLRFPNEESYRGGWKDSKPEGEGCYTWADGSTYEGAWNAGLKHGWGKYQWRNGACYQGEWRDGYMQGYGTFQSPDGARYAGNWQANLKHGIGKKVYANGDTYEGLWRHGKAEGPGRYLWHNGNQYDGEWRAGKMHGQGTLKWMTGERYDGEWGEGQEDGIGVFTWRDGSTYEGFWSGGKKTGVGVFRPAPRATAQLAPSASEPIPRTRPAAAAGEPPRSPVGSPLAADAPLDSPSAGAMHRRDALAAEAGMRGGGGGPFASEVVFVCQYERGRLLHEEALSTQDLELIFGPAQQAVDRRRRLRRGRRRQVRLGETIYKGHRSYDLMLNLQLGVRYTITTLNKMPAPAHLAEAHYQEKVWLRFPREGSEVTPPHPSNDFKWKDYCTTAFKRLRDLFGIDHSQYILSICGDQALREMASPGKSGSVFFISHDDQFMIKTMHKEEIKLLLSMLPKYVRHAEQNSETLLTRFYGVHRVKPSHGRKVRFVVMNNVFRTELELHRKYDLKGSTYGRTAGPKPGASAIRKDLDLDVSFQTDPKLQSSLAAQLAADCAFLEDIRVMDYSLLLGLHRRHLGDTSASPLNTDREDGDAYVSAEEAGGQGAPHSEGEEETDAFQELGSSSFAGHTSGGDSLAAVASSASFAGQAARAEAERRQWRRSTSGLAVAPTSDSDAEVAHSIHSATVEHHPEAQPQQRASPGQSSQQLEVEGRSPSFLRKSFTWRSFTARRPLGPQLAPALNQQQALQPAHSAQITPRVQPSVLPTPRAAAPPPPAPVPAAGSSRRLTPPPPAAGSADIAIAVQAAAAGEAAVANGGAPANGGGEAGDWRRHQETRQARHQQQWDADGGLPTWRSDAVQLPEQQQHAGLPDGIPASPTGSLETSGSMPRGRGGGGGAPPLTAIREVPASGRHWHREQERLESAEPQQQETQQQGRGQERGAGASPPPPAAPSATQQRQGAAAGSDGSREQQQAWRGGGSPFLAADPASPAAARDLAATGTPPDASVAASTPPRAAAAAAAASPVSSHASGGDGATPGWPAGEGRGAASPTRGLPLPGGVPRIALQGLPQQGLQPQRDSNDWMAYATSVSEAGLSGRDSDLRSTQRQAGSSPASDAATSPASVGQRRRSTPPPGGGGLALDGTPGRSPFQSPGASSHAGLASAPATARPAPVAAAAAAPTTAVHRLAQAAGPAPAARSPAADPSPAGSGRGRGPAALARTASAPAGQLVAAADDAAPRRQLSHQRGASMVLGREGSVVDLASPEAAAVAARVTARLSRRVTDQLVQDLVKLARYRMVGATAAAPSRHSRMPTMVLAARHMRRSSGSAAGTGPGGTPLAAAGPPPQPWGSSQDEGGGGCGGTAAGALAVAAAAVAPPRRLGIGVPAVAISRQAGQGPEEVVLFFGIIDFLQEYNMRKMLEHGFKAVVQDARGISVVEPRAYARRFLKCMDRVFPAPQQPVQHHQPAQQQP